jgi:hypothetical protein
MLPTKIDIFTHEMLPHYNQGLCKYDDKSATEKIVQKRHPVLTDYETRLGKLKPYNCLVQVFPAIIPPVEEIIDAKGAAKLVLIREAVNGIEKMCSSDTAKEISRKKRHRNLVHLQERGCFKK